METIETQELIDKLRDHGKLITAILDDEVWTAKGRLKKAALCRALGVRMPQLNKMLGQCQELVPELN